MTALHLTATVPDTTHAQGFEDAALRAGQALAMSLVVNRNDGDSRSHVEWGGGVTASKDPTAFNWLMLCPF